MLKKYIASVFIILYLCTITAIAQQNNSTPVIYRLTGQLFSLPTRGDISIIDPLTQTEINQISLAQTPGEVLEISQDQKKAFITPFFDKGILVVDLISGSVKKVLSSLLTYGVKQAQDGTLWVLVSIPDNQIVLVDPKTLITISTLTNVTEPRDIVFSPDGNKAFVSLENNNILIFDTRTKSLLSTISNLPSGVNGFTRHMELAISSDGNILCLGTKNNIFFIDTSSLQTIDSVTFNNKSKNGLVLVSFNINNDAVYFSEKNGLSVYKYTLKDKTLTTLFTSKKFDLEDMKLSPDGKLLYISDFGGKTIIDTQTDSVIFSITDLPQTNSRASEGIALAGDFSVGQPPTLQTTSPIGSQQVMPNQAFNIRWQTTVMPQSYSIASHRIELSTDSGATFNVIPGAEQLKAEDQSFIWQVPDIEVAKAQIRVSTVDLGARRASSTTSNFSISKGGSTGDTQAPTVNFLSPKGGERFNSGDSLQVSWMSSDNVGVSSQDLSLSTDGGATFPIIIASGLSGAAQNFTYSIPQSLQSDQTRLRLIVRDGAGNSAQAITVNNFSIVLGADTIPPTVVISQPTQSQSIVAGQPIQVKWQSTDNRAVVSQALLLSLDGGKTFSQISSFGATDNSFVLSNLDKLNFTTPQAIVKITAIDSTGNKGEANSTFTISPAITNVIYQPQNKLLSITGIGFMSNVNNTVRLFVNGKEVSLTPKSVSNSTFTIKGNKKKLTLTKGANTAQLVVDGVMSNSFSFTF